jgi:PAS domain S-box-containing protein
MIQELTASQQLILQSIRSSPDGWVIADCGGNILVANEAACELFGYEKDGLIGLQFSDLSPRFSDGFNAKSFERFTSVYRERLKGAGIEVEGIRKDGNAFHFRLAISAFTWEGATYFTALMFDITERISEADQMMRYTQNLEAKVKQSHSEVVKTNEQLNRQIAEKEKVGQQLRQSQQLHDAIVQNFPNGCINVLNTDFTYIFTQGQKSHIKNVRGEDLIGTDYLATFPEANRAMMKEELMRVKEGKEANVAMAFGKEHYRIRATPLFEDNKDIQHILVVENNITEQKQAERELAKALQTEKEVNELKSRFVSMASHEFRTPLSTISSSALLIGKYRDANQLDQIQKHLNRIQSNVTNLTHILNDFLNVEKLESGLIRFHPEPINLEELVNEVIEETSPLLKTGQRVAIKVLMEEPTVTTDPYLVRNILTNLISNAVKYSDKKQLIEIIISRENELVCLAVKDYGIGISEQEKEHMFSRFFRAKNATNIKGTGLGLTIVKRYADLMGAEVTFESKLNEGTTFFVKFKPTE